MPCKGMVDWLGCIAIELYGSRARGCRLSGCAAVWMNGCMGAWLAGCIGVRVYGCMGVKVKFNCMAFLLLPYKTLSLKKATFFKA